MSETSAVSTALCLPDDPAWASPPDALPLSSLQRGEKACVLRLLPHVFAARLRDLGFVEGSLVSVRLRAPLGDPTEYEIRGTRICLRAQDARLILVRPQASPPPMPWTPAQDARETER